MRPSIEQKGMTLPEALIVLAISALVVLAVTMASMSWVSRERMRSTVYLMHTQIGLARIEAVNRNRSCRFVLDTSARRLSVVDLNDPGSSGDDVELSSVPFHPAIAFARPDAGLPVTLNQPTASTYDIVFTSDGTIDTATTSAGEIVIHGGERYDRITVFVAGGIQVHHWDGSAWSLGS